MKYFRRKLFFICAILVLCISTFGFITNAYAAAGDDAENPIAIADCVDLQSMSSDLDAYYAITEDEINCSSTSFTAIGDYTHQFFGHLDGNGSTIVGLTFNNASSDQGLFSYVGSGATISNINFVDASLDVSYFSGVVAGYVTGATLSNISVDGSVTSDGTAGGVIGVGNGVTLTNITSSADVDTGGGQVAGGIAGRLESGASTVTDVHASGDVSGQGPVGGAFGYLESATVTGSSASGSADATDGAAGGFAGGTNHGSISTSYATGDVTSSTSGNAGGFVGLTDTTAISESAATGNVSAGGTVGGFVGFFIGSLTDVFARGAATGTSGTTSAGGLVGRSITGSTITNSYSTGTPTTDFEYIGGLVGNLSGTTVTSSYWDQLTEDISSTSGGVPAGGSPEVTSDMKLIDTFVGWDFDDTWDFLTTNDGYACLVNLPEGGPCDGESTTPTTTTTEPETTTTLPTSSPTVGFGSDGSSTSLTVSPGDSITVHGTGFKADSTVTATLHSAPVVLGTVHTNAQGSFTGTFTIPSNTTLGQHVLTLSGLDPNGNEISSTLSLTVSNLPTTGSNSLQAILLAITFLFAGSMLIFAVRMKRKTLFS
jgi:hypothetical protein